MYTHTQLASIRIPDHVFLWANTVSCNILCCVCIRTRKHKQTVRTQYCVDIYQCVNDKVTASGEGGTLCVTSDSETNPGTGAGM